MSSRCSREPLDPRHGVVVGWDEPTSTFFLTVLDEQSDDENDQVVAWIGLRDGEIQDPDVILTEAAAYAVIAPDLAQRLATDRATAAPFVRNPAITRFLDLLDDGPF